MSSEVIIDVIDRLIGDYEPYGETNHDKISNDNLEVLCDVVNYYVGSIYKLLDNRKAPEYSIKESGYIAEELFNGLSDYFEDWEKENE